VKRNRIAHNILSKRRQERKMIKEQRIEKTQNTSSKAVDLMDWGSEKKSRTNYVQYTSDFKD
jgi:hypothetical protein